MSDRKLIEQAAVACGYDTSHPWNALRLTLDPPVLALCIPEVSTGWNPLDRNEYAFKLAVTLRFEVYYRDEDVPTVFVNTSRGNGTTAIFAEPLGNDPYAATRRAIVRAAAYVGTVLNDEMDSPGTGSHVALSHSQPEADFLCRASPEGVSDRVRMPICADTAAELKLLRALVEPAQNLVALIDALMCLRAFDIPVTVTGEAGDPDLVDAIIDAGAELSSLLEHLPGALLSEKHMAGYPMTGSPRPS